MGTEDSGAASGRERRGALSGFGVTTVGGGGGACSRMDGGNAMQCNATRSRGEEEDVRKGDFGDHTVRRTVGWRGKRRFSENG